MSGKLSEERLASLKELGHSDGLSPASSEKLFTHITALDSEIAALRTRLSQIEQAARELAYLMDDTVTGDYKPDSLTTQPIWAALAALVESKPEKGEK